MKAAVPQHKRTRAPRVGAATAALRWQAVLQRLTGVQQEDQQQQHEMEVDDQEAPSSSGRAETVRPIKVLRGLGKGLAPRSARPKRVSVKASSSAHAAGAHGVVDQASLQQQQELVDNINAKAQRLLQPHHAVHVASSLNAHVTAAQQRAGGVADPQHAQRASAALLALQDATLRMAEDLGQQHARAVFSWPEGRYIDQCFDRAVRTLFLLSYVPESSAAPVPADVLPQPRSIDDALVARLRSSTLEAGKGNTDGVPLLHSPKVWQVVAAAIACCALDPSEMLALVADVLPNNDRTQELTLRDFNTGEMTVKHPNRAPDPKVGIASFVEYLLPVIMAQAFFLNVVLAGGAARNFIDRLFSDAGYLAECKLEAVLDITAELQAAVLAHLRAVGDPLYDDLATLAASGHSIFGLKSARQSIIISATRALPSLLGCHPCSDAPFSSSSVCPAGSFCAGVAAALVSGVRVPRSDELPFTVVDRSAASSRGGLHTSWACWIVVHGKPLKDEYGNNAIFFRRGEAKPYAEALLAARALVGMAEDDESVQVVQHVLNAMAGEALVAGVEQFSKRLGRDAMSMEDRGKARHQDGNGNPRPPDYVEPNGNTYRENQQAAGDVGGPATRTHGLTTTQYTAKGLHRPTPGGPAHATSTKPLGRAVMNPQGRACAPWEDMTVFQVGCSTCGPNKKLSLSQIESLSIWDGDGVLVHQD